MASKPDLHYLYVTLDSVIDIIEDESEAAIVLEQIFVYIRNEIYRKGKSFVFDENNERILAIYSAAFETAGALTLKATFEKDCTVFDIEFQTFHLTEKLPLKLSLNPNDY